MRFVSAVSCLLSTAVLAATASAGTIKVSPGPGTPLTDAVALLQNGDKLLILKGDYPERLVLKELDDITVVGKGLVRILGTTHSPLALVDSCNGVSIQRLTIGPAENDGLTVSDSSDVTLKKLTANQAGATAFRVVNSIDVTLRSCVALGDPEQEGSHTGVTAWDVVRLRIDRCRFGAGLERGIAMNHSDALPNIDVTVTKCRFDGVQIQAMLVGGVGLVVEKNRFSECGTGIRTSGTGEFSMLIRKNRFQELTGPGVHLVNPGVTVSKNSFRDSASWGVLAATEGTDAVLSKNNIRNSTTGGLFVAGDRAVVSGNRVIGSQGDTTRGIAALADDSVYEKNRVLKNEGTGLDIFTGGCIFRKNTVKKSGMFDLKSSLPEDANTFEGNTFGSVSFP